MTKRTPNQLPDSEQQLLARAAIAAAQQQPVAAEPTADQWQAFRRGNLQGADAEVVYGWLNEHPEAYERWLAQPVAVSEKSGFVGWLSQTMAEWLSPKPLMAAAALLLLSVGTISLMQQSASDPLGNALQTASATLSDQQRSQLANDLLPWQQPDALGFAGKQGDSWQRDFSVGLLAGQQRLLATANAMKAAGSSWFDYGRLNVIFAAMAQQPTTSAEQWSDVAGLLQALSLNPANDTAKQRLLDLVQPLTSKDSGRARKQLERELAAQRLRFAVDPQA